MTGAEYETWHVYDMGPARGPGVRYRDDRELPAWQGGPDVSETLHRAEAEGWREYDREPGDAPGEVAIIHLKREHPRTGCTTHPCAAPDGSRPS